MTVQYQQQTALILLAGYIQLFLFDAFYTFNWFGVNDITWMVRHGEHYMLGEVLCNMDQFLLLFSVTWVFRRATNKLRWTKWFSWFIYDILIVGTVFTLISNPYVKNWNKLLCIGISLFIFVSQIIYHGTSRKPRNSNF